MDKKERITVREIKKTAKPPEAPVGPFHAEIKAMEKGDPVTKTTDETRNTLRMFLGALHQPQAPLTFAVPKSDHPPAEPAQSIIVDISADEVMKLVEGCFKDVEKYRKVKSIWLEEKSGLEAKKKRVEEIKELATETANAMLKLGVNVDKEKFETVKIEELIELMVKAGNGKKKGLRRFFNSDRKIAVEAKVKELEAIKKEFSTLNLSIHFTEKRIADYKNLYLKIHQELEENMGNIEAVLRNKTESETLPPQGPNANMDRLKGVEIMPFVRVKSALDLLKKALSDL